MSRTAARSPRAPLFALLFFALPAHAQPTPTAAAPADVLAPLDRTEPAQERRRLEKGTPEERSRVLARAAAHSADRDEAVALLTFAADRARPLELSAVDLVTVARGLAIRGRTKLARDGLFSVLDPPLEESGRAQRIAAIALARVADIPDPPYERPGRDETPKSHPDTLQRLLEAAERPRLEEIVTLALLRHPPRRAPRVVAGPSTFRIGARLGDLRWIPLVEATLGGRQGDEALRVAAIDAAGELGDARVLPQVRALTTHPSVAVASAALRAWVALDPAAGVAAIERALTRPNAPPGLFALARHASHPAALTQIAAQLGAREPGALPEAIRSLAMLPRGAGVSTLRTLAARDDSVHAAIRALGDVPDRSAVDALAEMLRDLRPVARHEAAYALWNVALARNERSAGARAALARNADTHPLPVRAWLRGEPTPRARAAAGRLDAVRDDHTLPRATLAACARSLRLEAPACAFAFGNALPVTLDASARDALRDLLAVADPSIRVELIRGLLQSAWPGRYAVLAQSLEHDTDLPLRRRLLRLALDATSADARAALDPVLARIAADEPDRQSARMLAGMREPLTAHPTAIRADADGVLRCGYSRDEQGVVRSFVLEEGGALVEAFGTTLEVTFTGCEAPPLQPGP